MPQYCIELECGKQPSYGYPGGPNLTCKEHHLYGMENVKCPRCKTIGCEKFTHVNGYCIDCARKNGVEGVIGTECKNKCGKQAQVDGFCKSCYNNEREIVRNSGENNFKNYLKESFPDCCLRTEFYILKYKIDFLIELEKLLVSIEHDENQHKDKSKYPIEREAQRGKEIFEKLSKKKRTVFIRFNPDNFKVNGIKVEVPLEDKMEMMCDFIEECISDETKSGIFRLFYDE